MFAAYVRVSRVGDRAERLISPDQQAAVIGAYAKQQGLEVEFLEPELDVSGGKLERPILGEVLAGIESGRFEGVIVAELSRLSRLSLSDALNLIERIEGAGAKVIAVEENYDASTPEGELQRNLMLSIHRMNRRRYAGQFAAAKEQAVRRGIWPLPVVPIGYIRSDISRGLEPGPDAPKVVRAFELRAQGEPWSRIGEVLGRGHSGAAKVIGNRVYLGEIRYGEWVNRDAHPAIVERGLWEAAQLDFPRPPRSDAPALLAGMLRCAGCRCLLTPDSRHGYRCHPRKAGGKCAAPALIARNVIEPFVEATALQHIADVRVEAPGGDLTEVEQVLEQAEAELAAYQRESSALAAEFSAEGLRLRVERVEQARRGLAEARAKVTPAWSVEIGELWGDLSVIERRHVLRGALGVVWIRKGRVPVSERVKVTTDTPPDLPRPGRDRWPVEPVEWDAITGVIPPPDDLLGGKGGS